MDQTKKISTILFYFIFSMFVALITSVVILHNSSYLIYFYVIALIIQLILLAKNYYKRDVLVTKRSLLLFGIYISVLSLPLISNYFLEIKTNSYDILNIILNGFYFFVLYCIFDNIKVSKYDIKKFAKYVIILGIIACAYNFTFGLDEILKIFSVSSSYQVNVKSFFTNRNDFGGFMSIALISVFYFYGDDKSNKTKYFILLLFAINGLLTLSRSAILGIFLYICFMFYKKYKHTKKIYLISAVILIILCLVFMNNNIINTLNNLVIRPDNFDSNRVNLWKYGIDIIKLNPVFGFGAYSAIDLAHLNGNAVYQFHSFFIETTASYGIIGLIFILALLFSCFIRCMKKCPDKYYKNIYLISFLVLLFKMFIESISFFSIGYSSNLTTIYYITIPILLSNMKQEGVINEKK